MTIKQMSKKASATCKSKGSCRESKKLHDGEGVHCGTSLPYLSCKKSDIPIVQSCFRNAGMSN